MVSFCLQAGTNHRKEGGIQAAYTLYPREGEKGKPKGRGSLCLPAVRGKGEKEESQKADLSHLLPGDSPSSGKEKGIVPLPPPAKGGGGGGVAPSLFSLPSPRRKKEKRGERGGGRRSSFLCLCLFFAKKKKKEDPTPGGGKRKRRKRGTRREGAERADASLVGCLRHSPQGGVRIRFQGSVGPVIGEEKKKGGRLNSVLLRKESNA